MSVDDGAASPLSPKAREAVERAREKQREAREAARQTREEAEEEVEIPGFVDEVAGPGLTLLEGEAEGQDDDLPLRYTPRLPEREFLMQETTTRELRWKVRLDAQFRLARSRILWWPISGYKPVASADTQLNRLRKGKVGDGKIKQRVEGEEGWEFGCWLDKDQDPPRKVIVARWVEQDRAEDEVPVGNIAMEKIWDLWDEEEFELEVGEDGRDEESTVNSLRYEKAFREGVATYQD